MSLNTTVWRTHPQRANGFAFILKPAPLYTASVNQASFTYPLASLAYDGASGTLASVKAGHTLKVLSQSGAFKGYARVRTLPTGSSVGIGEAGNGEIDFADNDQLIFQDEFRLWTKTPRILSDGTGYKDYDLTVGTNTTTPPPKANGGAWYIGDVDPDTGLITVAFDAGNSFAVADGASISSQAWVFPGGTPASSSSATPTVTFGAGQRWCSLTVTDSNGKTHTMYILVVAIDPDTNPAFQATVTNYSNTLQGGAAIELALHDTTLDSSVFEDGAIVLYYEDERYGDTRGSLTGYPGREHVKFVGYITGIRTGVTPFTSDVTISAANPLAILGDLPAYPQVVERSASPTVWTEAAALNWWQFYVYLVRWHSTAFELFDFERPSHYADYPVTRLDGQAGALRDQLEDSCRAVASKFTCDRTGRFKARRYPHLMSSSQRSSNAVAVTLADTDWTEGFEIAARQRDAVGWLNASGILASASAIVPVLAAAPGKVPGQGVSQEQLDRQLIASQGELNQRAGAWYAYRNRDTESIVLPILNQGGVVDPADMEWVKFILAASSNRRGLTYTSSDRFLCTGVDISYDALIGASLERWTLEPDAPYVDAVTIPVPGVEPGTTYEEQPYPDYEEPPVWDVEPIDTSIPDDGIAIIFSNPVGYTTTRQDPGWTSIHSPIGETSQCAVGDEYSDFYQSGSGALGVYHLTNARLYYADDVTTESPSFTQQGTITNHTLLRLVRGVDGGIAAYNPSGTVTYSPDRGATLTPRYFGAARSTSSTYADNFTGGVFKDQSSIGGEDFTFFRPPDGTATHPAGELSPTGGNTGGCVVSTATGTFEGDDPEGQRQLEATVVVDLGAETTVTAASMDYKLEPATQGNSVRIWYYDEDRNAVATGTDGGTDDDSWHTYSHSSSHSGVRYVVFGVQFYVANAAADAFGWIDNISVTFNTLPMTGGMDSDDFNQGVLAMVGGTAASTALYYTQADYSATPVRMTSVPLSGSIASYNLLRIPYRKPSDNAFNDDWTALQIVWGANGLVNGESVWRGIFNGSTNVVSGSVAMTPVVSGTTFVVAPGFGDQLEALASNAQEMIGCFRPVDGGDTRILYTDDAGATWADRGDYDYKFVRWQSATQIWFAGTAGAGYSDDAALTIEDRTGDYGSIDTVSQIRGVFPVG